MGQVILSLIVATIKEFETVLDNIANPTLEFDHCILCPSEFPVSEGCDQVCHDP